MRELQALVAETQRHARELVALHCNATSLTQRLSELSGAGPACGEAAARRELAGCRADLTGERDRLRGRVGGELDKRVARVE